MAGDGDWKQRLPDRKQPPGGVGGPPEPAGADDAPFRGGWLDVLALIIATYQVLAVPFLILIAGFGLAVGLFFFLFR